MSISKPKGRKNLTREVWMHAAFELLSVKGVSGVSIDTLSKYLGVTRGSFYHHFDNRKDLLISILDYWIETWTVQIRESILNLDLDASTALLALMNTIRNQKAADNDAVIRAWAMHDELAATYVRRADKIRLDFIRSLFESLGFEGVDLESRARMLLYYEAFEPMMFHKSDPKTSKELIALRHSMLTGL